MNSPQRRTLGWLLAFWPLLGFLLLGTAAQAHDHSHRHAPATHAEATASSDADEGVSDESAPDHDHGHHHHSGDPLKDLLTLGHNHVSGAFPGLPPTLWILAAAPHSTEPVVPWPERTPGDSPPDNPFRPPIA